MLLVLAVGGCGGRGQLKLLLELLLEIRQLLLVRRSGRNQLAAALQRAQVQVRGCVAQLLLLLKGVGREARLRVAGHRTRSGARPTCDQVRLIVMGRAHRCRALLVLLLLLLLLMLMKCRRRHDGHRVAPQRRMYGT